MKIKRQDIDDAPLTFQLAVCSAKVRAMGFLFENLADEENPEDLEHIYWGIGISLSEISREMKTISQELDRKKVK